MSEHSIEKLMGEAHTLNRSGQSIEAEACCRRILGQNAAHLEATLLLGTLLQRNGAPSSISEAIHLYETFVQKCPTSGEAYAALGDARRLNGELNSAVAAYEMALTYIPDHLGAHIGVADIFVEKGWLHTAAIVLEDALAAAPGSEDARTRLEAVKIRIAEDIEAWRRDHGVKHRDAPRPT